MDVNSSLLILKIAKIMAIFLCLGFILSYGARQNWLMDLFSHFVIQYFVFGLILAIIFAIFQSWTLALMCLIVASISVYNLEPRFKQQASSQNAHTITIAQYNQFHATKNHDAMIEWLKNNAANFDIVTIQEITPEVVKSLQSLNDIYPYQFPESPTKHADVYIISKHKIIAGEIIDTSSPGLPSKTGFHARIEIAGLTDPLSFYTIHTKSPMSKKRFKQRNQELSHMANLIESDSSKAIIFTGDWNISPYSPHFKSMLIKSKLSHRYNGLWPPTTWPSIFLAHFLKIPIDHILASDKLHLKNYSTIGAMRSDHHPIIAEFAFDKKLGSKE